MHDEHESLEYQTPNDVDRKTSQWGAWMLCTPGVLCLLVGFAPDHLLREILPSFIIGQMIWPLVLIAFITALLSLYQYARMPRKPWFVIVNLTINTAGLILAVAGILGVISP